MDAFIAYIDRFRADRSAALRSLFPRLAVAQVIVLLVVTAAQGSARYGLTLAFDLAPLALVCLFGRHALRDQPRAHGLLSAAGQAVLIAAAFHCGGAPFGVAFAAFSYMVLSAFNNWHVTAFASCFSLVGIVYTAVTGAITGVLLSASAHTYGIGAIMLFAGPFTVLAFIAQRDEETRDKESSSAEAQAPKLMGRGNTSRTDFLANMSHEIRTPLTAIQGFTDLLSDPATSAFERDEYVGTIRRNTSHLLQIINDILDLSKIEAGRMAFEAIPTEPAGLLRDVKALLHMSAEQKGLTFDVVYDTPVPELITSDPTRIRQILLNLASNAIKFTERGSVTIAAGFEHGESPRLYFDVRDTGIGLKDDQRERLFQAFSQADACTTRKFGGTGLGLVISQQMAEKLGGGIDVTSVYGVGSTFRVTIDAGDVQDVFFLDEPDETRQRVRAMLPETDLDETLGARILLAEDGKDNQRLISHVLRKAGATVTVVDNGADAVQAAMHAMRTEPFHVVFMDMQMPIMDGYVATQTLRDAGYVRPIIALTAHAMADDRHKCLEAGCDDYLTKPIDRRAMIERVQDAMLDGQLVFVRDAANVNLEARTQRPEERPAVDTNTPIRSTFADDADMAPLVDLFVAELPVYLERLLAAHADHDDSTCQHIAHQLKGAGSGYGFDDVTRVARVLEQDPAQRDDALNELQTLVSRIEAGHSNQATTTACPGDAKDDRASA